MELVISATSLDISKQISIRNKLMNKKIIMEIVITATSLGIIKNISARKEWMNKQILQSTKN